MREFAELFGGDLSADVVDLCEHGALVDALVIFAHTAAVPDKSERNALFIERTFKHRAVFVVHKSRSVGVRTQPRNTDRHIERFSRKGKRLVFDDVHLSDVQLIKLDGDVNARTHANC